MQELEDCLNEVHNQISDELERTDSSAAKETTQTSISDLVSFSMFESVLRISSCYYVILKYDVRLI